MTGIEHACTGDKKQAQAARNGGAPTAAFEAACCPLMEADNEYCNAVSKLTAAVTAYEAWTSL